MAGTLRRPEAHFELMLVVIRRRSVIPFSVLKPDVHEFPAGHRSSSPDIRPKKQFMGSFEPSIDPTVLQIALGVFILGVCFFCLRQVADVLERQTRLRELEERVRTQESERKRTGRPQ